MDLLLNRFRNPKTVRLRILYASLQYRPGDLRRFGCRIKLPGQLSGKGHRAVISVGRTHGEVHGNRWQARTRI